MFDVPESRTVNIYGLECTVSFKVQCDELNRDPMNEQSGLGEFVNYPEKDGHFYVRIAHGESAYIPNKSCEYWKSSETVSELAEYYVKNGLTKTKANEEAITSLRKRFDYIHGWYHDEWTYCGLVVSIHYNDMHIGDTSLWSIESNRPQQYIDEKLTNLEHKAIDRAKEEIARLANRITLEE